MDDFQAKSRMRRLVYSRPVIVVLVIIIVLLARPVWKIWLKSRAVAREQAQVAAELKELELRRDFLEQEIAALQTPRGIEGEIREKFPVVKEGEKVIIVDGGDESTTTLATSSKSWWGKIFK
jgi:cell division protein FtsB